MRCALFGQPIREFSAGPQLSPLAAAGFGGACAAQPAGDGLTQPAAYHGPFLTWAGKTGGPVARRRAAPSRAASRPQRSSPPGPRPRAPAAPSVRPAPTAAIRRRDAAMRRADAPAAQPPSAAAYVAPPAPQPRPAAVAAYVAPPRGPSASARRRSSPRRRRPPRRPGAAAGAAAGPKRHAAPPAASPAVLQPTGAHFYSLHREYGLTPDAVVTPKDRPMVLIGPPDNPPRQKPDNADGDGANDKHGGGEGADD